MQLIICRRSILPSALICCIWNWNSHSRNNFIWHRCNYLTINRTGRTAEQHLPNGAASPSLQASTLCSYPFGKQLTQVSSHFFPMSYLFSLSRFNSLQMRKTKTHLSVCSLHTSLKWQMEMIFFLWLLWGLSVSPEHMRKENCCSWVMTFALPGREVGREQALGGNL